MNTRKIFGLLFSVLLVLSTIAAAFAAPPFTYGPPNEYVYKADITKSDNGALGEADEDGLDDFGDDKCPFVWSDFPEQNGDVDNNVDTDFIWNLCDPNNYKPYCVSTDASGLKTDSFTAQVGSQLIVNFEGKHGDPANEGETYQANYGDPNDNFNVKTIDITEDPSTIGVDAIPVTIEIEKVTKDNIDVAKPFPFVLTPNGDNKYFIQWTPGNQDVGEYKVDLLVKDGGEALHESDLEKDHRKTVSIIVEEAENQCPAITTFTAVPSEAEIGEDITFTATIDNKDGDETTCFFFDQGGNLLDEVTTNGNTCSTTQSFANAGDQIVMVQVTDNKNNPNDDGNCIDEMEVTVTITEPDNICPTGGISFLPVDPVEGDTLVFKADTPPINDPDGDTAKVMCTWKVFQGVGGPQLPINPAQISDLPGLDAGNGCVLTVDNVQGPSIYVELFLEDENAAICSDNNVDEVVVPIAEKPNECPSVTLFPEQTQTVQEGSSVSFTTAIINTDDADADIECTWTVTHDDGSQDVFKKNGKANCEAANSVLFDVPGTSTVKVEVTDGKNDANGIACSDVDTTDVVVTEIPPVNECPVITSFTSSNGFIVNDGEAVNLKVNTIQSPNDGVQGVTQCVWEIKEEVFPGLFQDVEILADTACEVNYLAPHEGTYKAVVTVLEDQQICQSTEEKFRVNGLNECPAVEIVPKDITIAVGTTQTFTGLIADPNNDVVGCSVWQVDGVTQQTGAIGDDAACTFQFTFDTLGQHTVTLLGTDGKNDPVDETLCLNQFTTTVTVEEIANVCPAGNIKMTPEIPIEGDDITFEAVTLVDPENDQPITCDWKLTLLNADGTAGGVTEFTDVCAIQVLDAKPGSFKVDLFLSDNKVLSDGTEQCVDNLVDTVDVTIGETIKDLIAVLDAEPKKGFEPLTVDFSCTNSIVVPKGTAFTCAWDLGDGSTDDQKTFKHEYKKEGTYKVKLVVTSAHGLVDDETTTIFVFPVVPTPELEPREVLEFVGLELLNGDYYCRGDDAELLLTLTNIREDDLDDVKATVYVPGINGFFHVGPFNLESGEKKTIFMPVTIPEDAELGEHSVRVFAGSDKIQRIVHRRLVVENCPVDNTYNNDGISIIGHGLSPSQ